MPGKGNSLRFDYWLFSAMCLVCLFGLLGIFSLVYKNVGLIAPNILIKQIVAFLIGLLAIIFCSQFNYPTLKKYAFGFYFTSIILLLLVLIFGAKIRNVRSWFMLGPFSFQPSELAKLAFIIFLAKYIEEVPGWESWRELVWPSCLLILPVGLILAQPDMGVTLVFFPIFLAMLYIGRCNYKYLMSLAGVGFLMPILLLLKIYLNLKNEAGANFVVSIISNFGSMSLFLLALFIIAYLIYFLIKKLKYKIEFKNIAAIFAVIAISLFGSYLFEHFLKEYQEKRLVVFLDPYIDPLGSGYNIIQSKIAIGSGALWGKGLLYGTQSRLGFLPEQHTDFIFSVLAEQFGFAGSVILLILFLVIIWRGLIIINQARDEFGALVAAGIVTMFSFHVFLNIGMTLGVMPITGIPLPLVSYGGSSLVMNMLAIGVLLNIRLKRFFY